MASQLKDAWETSFLGGRSSFEIGMSLFPFVLILGLSRAIYLLYFHPLASFPGPYKAALSTWWQYSLSKTGRTEQILEQLHEKYDTQALRIGPNELHITDPTLYHTIYSQRYTYPKHKYFYDGFNNLSNSFIEADKDAHRARRKLLNNFFSKASIRSMEQTLFSKVTLLCDRLSDTKDNGAINFYHAFRCLTVDFITQIAFGESFNMLTEAEDNTFNAPFITCFDLASEQIWNMLYFPILRTIAFKCPPSVTARLSTSAARFQGLVRKVAKTVVNFRDLKASGKSLDHEIVFDAMQHLDDATVESEAANILIAGSDTTAFTLSTAVQHMMKDPTIFVQLRKELRESGVAATQDFTLVKLEQLPYLTACVKESLRYAMPVPGRLPRVVPHGIQPLVVDEKIVPAGAVVGIPAYSMHFDESIWGEDARKFNPARWRTEDAKELEKYLVTFSKGARQCLGINLAYAEITLTLAMLVNRFRFEPDATITASDVQPLDHFATEYEGTGVRAMVYEE